MMEEREAIAQLKLGDIGGLEVLVKLYQTEALRTAYLIVRDNAQAEDIVQSAFVRVHERISQFDSGRPFKPWFLRIVANDAIKFVQRTQITFSLDADSIDARDSTLRQSSESSLPEAILERAETREELWSLLGDLPPRQRAIVVLRYYVGLDSSEIADLLDIPPGTVRWRLHSALNRLNGFLKWIDLPRNQKGSVVRRLTGER